ncbi:MAG: hypothetical protein ACMUEL_05930 [Flavobacteriales bacterium Tduv]
MNYIWNVLPEGVSFFKVKYFDLLGRDGRGISLFKMMILGHWYDFSDVGMEELVKRPLELHALFWFSIGRSNSRSYDSMQISQ